MPAVRLSWSLNATIAMPQKADIGSKRLISQNPNAWAQWITQRPLLVRDILDPQFQWLSREGDILLKVLNLTNNQEILIAHEIQLRYRSTLPRRIRAYTALAEEKYQLPVYPILLNILPPSAPDTTNHLARFQSQVWDIQAIQDFRVINLWEQDATIAFTQTQLLPFVPIMQGGGTEAMVQEAVDRLRQDETLSEFENLLAFFATFILETEVIQQIMRWDMAILKESPWYRQIVQESEQRGEQRGIQIGEQRGIQRIARNLLNAGMAPEQITQMTGLNAEQIQNLQSNGN